MSRRGADPALVRAAFSAFDNPPARQFLARPPPAAQPEKPSEWVAYDGVLLPLNPALWLRPGPELPASPPHPRVVCHPARVNCAEVVAAFRALFALPVRAGI